MSNCKLYVPKGSGEAYKNAPIWKDFQNIIEEERLGISTLNASKVQNAYFTLGGQRVNQPTRSGIYVNNGKKVVVK